MTDRPQEPTPETEARIAELFSHLQPPEIPAELKDEAFLIGVYEQAAAAETAGLSTILAATLTPRVVPDEQQWDDVAWNDVPWDEGAVAGPAVRDQVAATMPAGPGRAPGVLWTRIRADIDTQRTEWQKAKSSHWLRRAAAAILISAGLVGFLRYGLGYFNPDGTTMEGHFVFVEKPGLDSPLDQFLGR